MCRPPRALGGRVRGVGLGRRGGVWIYWDSSNSVRRYRAGVPPRQPLPLTSSSSTLGYRFRVLSAPQLLKLLRKSWWHRPRPLGYRNRSSRRGALPLPPSIMNGRWKRYSKPCVGHEFSIAFQPSAVLSIRCAIRPSVIGPLARKYARTLLRYIDLKDSVAGDGGDGNYTID